MERSKERLSSKTASRLSFVLGLGLLIAGPGMAVGSAQTQQSGTRSDLAIESDVLKALASYPDISSEQIAATTQNGVVTLNGTASTSTASGQAQVVAATVNGVRSVVSHVQVTGAPAAKPSAATPQQGPSPTLERRQEPVQQAQSTGNGEEQSSPQPSQTSRAGARGDWGKAGPPPDVQDGQVPAPPQEDASRPQTDQQAEGYPIEDPAGQDSAGQDSAGQRDTPPAQRQSYPRPPYGQRSPRPYPAGGNYPVQRAHQYPPARLASTPFTVPERTLLTVRTSEPLDSRHLQGGEPFQAIVAQDIYEGEYLAIPRGAVLDGRVIGVKKPGAFSGGAGFALQITALNLGGHSYPVATDTFASDTRGKGGYTTANTIGGAAIGAIIGGIAGRGPGAAIGAAAGGVVGAGASAATPGPREVMPPETPLSFHLRAPLTINPITSAEVQRLQASAQPQQQPRQFRRPRPYGYPYAYGYPPPPPYYYRPYYPYRYYYWR